MSSTPPIQPASRASTGAISQQPTLVQSSSRQSTRNSKIDPSAHKAFSVALDEFRRRLTKKECAEFSATTYRALMLELLHTQRKQEEQKELLNLQRIQRFLEGMENLGKTIEVFVNVNDTVAFVWGPIKFCLLAASNVVETFDTLLDAYEQIGDVLPFLEGVEPLFGDNPRLIEALIWIYLDILKFHQRAIRFFHGSKLSRLFKAFWKDFETEFRGILNSLQRHKDMVENQASLSHYRNHRDDMDQVKEKLSDMYRKYRDDMDQIQKKLDKSIEEEREKKLSEVVNWLGVDQRANEDHLGFRETREAYKTTAKWILDREYVQHWLEADVPTTPILWIHGIPGAGKTVLASAIVDRCKAKQDFATCFFYCHEGDQSCNSALPIIKGLVSQLLVDNQHIRTLLPPCYSRKRQSGEPVLRSIGLAKKVFEDCCIMMNKMFVIIDGLDECDFTGRSQIIKALMEIVAQCDADVQGKLRILIMSQELADIKKALQSSGNNRLAPRILRISENDTTKDISTYVRFWVDKLATKFFPFTDDMQRYLRSLTIVNSKGMFLYAKLVLEDLYKHESREEFLDSIKSDTFPKGLQEAYERIVRRIKSTSSDKQWSKAKRLLGWMVCAKRQLTWKEIQVAVSMDGENQEIEYDNRRMRTHIHDICGSLVVMTGERITLVHSTAKTFITTTPEGIHEPSVETELTILCLQYLTFPCFSMEGIDDKELKEMMLKGHFAFQDYAVAKWFYHVNAMVNSGKRLLEEAPDRDEYLRKLLLATEEFISRHDEIDWEAGVRDPCRTVCRVFEGQAVYDNLLFLTSHIYDFQQKGFELRHKISIDGLANAVERNRKLLEEFPSSKTTRAQELEIYKQFYNEKKPFKCNKITCRYFSEGFAVKKARKRHVDIHDRPFHCDVVNCLGAEGFANNKDLDKHNRSFHPELTDLAQVFNAATTKKSKANHACTICGKTFTRKYHREDHEKSHRGLRPHACPECGRAFTRLNDMMRHQRNIHERGR